MLSANTIEHLETTIVFLQEMKQGINNPLLFQEVPTLDFLIRKHIIKMSDEWDVIEEIPENNLFKKTILFKNKVRITSEVERLTILQDMKEKTDLE